MNRTTAFCAVPVLLALAATPARAADEDVQLWLGELASAPLSSAVQGTLDLSQRFRDNGNQRLVRGTVEVRLSPHAVVGGGAAYLATLGAADEFRPHQQLTLTYGPVALRTRVEQRLFDHADRIELRLRQRIGVTAAVAHRLKAGIAGEVLYIAQSQDAGRGARVDQWRANATLAQQLARDLEGTAGYLAILAPRAGGPDRLSHVIQLSLTLRR